MDLPQQIAQAVVFLRARRTPAKVFPHSGNALIRVGAGKLVLDVDVEQLEALLAGQLGTARTQQPVDDPLRHWLQLTHRRLRLRCATCAAHRGESYTGPPGS